jgi:LysR family glycine cleavage system transcriptional activator
MAARLPPLSSLRAFEAVVRHGSVTRAAAELGVTQLAISQRLRQLEAFLERPLVRRDAGGIAISADGQAYAVRLERAFAEIRAVTEAIRAGAEGERALTISVLATFAQRWLIPRLAGFQQAHPEIEVRLLATSRIADLWREDVDLSIRPGAGVERGVRSDFLVANDLFPVASPALLERQPVRAPGDLAAQVLIRVEARAARSGLAALARRRRRGATSAAELAAFRQLEPCDRSGDRRARRRDRPYAVRGRCARCRPAGDAARLPDRR